MNLNKALIAGRLTRDPELKALPSGSSVCTFSLATNHSYKDRDGKQQETVEYHNVVVYGKAAENCGRYLTRGAIVLVEGRLQTRSWDKDGQKQYRTEILADKVQFGPKLAGERKDEANSVLPDYPEEEINPEDIPF